MRIFILSLHITILAENHPFKIREIHQILKSGHVIIQFKCLYPINFIFPTRSVILHHQLRKRRRPYSLAQIQYLRSKTNLINTTGKHSPALYRERLIKIDSLSLFLRQQEHIIATHHILSTPTTHEKRIIHVILNIPRLQLSSQIPIIQNKFFQIFIIFIHANGQFIP